MAAIVTSGALGAQLEMEVNFVKIILWLGFVPLFFGCKLLWRWAVVDRQEWEYLPQGYQQGFLIRIVAAIALILLGLYLFFGVGNFLGNR